MKILTGDYDFTPSKPKATKNGTERTAASAARPRERRQDNYVIETIAPSAPSAATGT